MFSFFLNKCLSCIHFLPFLVKIYLNIANVTMTIVYYKYERRSSECEFKRRGQRKPTENAFASVGKNSRFFPAGSRRDLFEDVGTSPAAQPLGDPRPFILYEGHTHTHTAYTHTMCYNLSARPLVRLHRSAVPVFRSDRRGRRRMQRQFLASLPRAIHGRRPRLDQLAAVSRTRLGSVSGRNALTRVYIYSYCRPAGRAERLLQVRGETYREKRVRIVIIN